MGLCVTLRDGPVALRPMRPEDAPLLLAWLRDPRNLEYWEGPGAVFTEERIQEDFFEEEPRRSQWIIQFQGADMGYLQAYALDGELFEEYEFPPREGKVYGIDQFIGVPELWGKGIGRRFLCLLAEHLLEAEGAEAIVLDPHGDNLRALRCYEACGFQKEKFLPRHELHGGEWVDCWLMVLTPAAFAERGG